MNQNRLLTHTKKGDEIRLTPSQSQRIDLHKRIMQRVYPDSEFQFSLSQEMTNYVYLTYRYTVKNVLGDDMPKQARVRIGKRGGLYRW